MGLCSSTPSGGALPPEGAIGASKEIDKIMAARQQQQQQEVKLILLGGGDSGKTTFRKQLRMIYGNKEFSDSERTAFKATIVGNIIDGINILVAATKIKFPDLELSDELTETAEELELISVEDEIGSEDVFTEDLTKRTLELWNSELLSETFKERDTLDLTNVSVNLDSVAKLIADLDIIFKPEYSPTAQHILFARQQTIDVSEESFDINGSKFRVVDVGGQRNERRKWLPLFESVTGVIFFASLAEYDQHLAEDKTRNRMHESLAIYEAIVNFHASNRPPPVLLFLNKKDLLQEKIVTVPLTVCFEGFVDESNYENAVEHIKRQYEKQNRFPKIRKVHMYCTNATDSNNIQLASFNN